ncbi:helix-turn-helix domain-containing protein [Acetobacter sp.]|uniref:helix-turn-helix domain-containing protein n=1 Tax=Acetobacter sp. TaxID=440 RepID=UPI0039ED6201
MPSSSLPEQNAAEALWAAIDRLALEKGLSSSGLARAAGLDPTALNPSKRRAPDGRTRLPRMETLLDLLAALRVTLGEFARRIEGEEASTADDTRQKKRLRLALFSQLDMPNLFDQANLPTSSLWSEVSSPFADIGPYDYGIRLNSAAYEPVFRRGSLLLVSPDSAIREQDRIVIHHQPTPVLGIVERWEDSERHVRRLDDGDILILRNKDSQARTPHRITAATL